MNTKNKENQFLLYNGKDEKKNTDDYQSKGGKERWGTKVLRPNLPGKLNNAMPINSPILDQLLTKNIK